MINDGNDSLLEKWRRFGKRTIEERRLILRAALMLPVTEFGLRVLGFQRCKELIEKLSPFAQPPKSVPVGVQLDTTTRAVRALRSAELHGLTRPNCLERSLALWWMLRRDGVEGDLHIGARRQGGNFEAHAWVELGGQVLNDEADVHRFYSRFDAPIATAPGGSNAARHPDSAPAATADSR